MKVIKHLNLRRNEDPLLITHPSSIIDNTFFDKHSKNKIAEDENATDDDLQLIEPKSEKERKLEEERLSIKRLDIRAIEFDWIFNENEGARFMRTLADTENLDIFTLQIIRYIIRFLWSSLRIYIVLYMLIPFIIYFCLFIFYATFIHKKTFENGAREWKDYGIGNTLCIIFLIIFVIYFAFFEVKQAIYHKRRYFKSFWNIIDIISLILNSIILISDLARMSEDDLIPLLSCSVILMWLKLFYFGRVIIKTAAMIRMVIEITYDMRYFLVVLIITICGFGNAFYILARNYDTEDLFTGNKFWKAFIYSYFQTLGSFDTKAYLDTDRYYLFLIWFVNTLVTLIIFLNLLIAIMGDTFDRVQETAENNMLKEIANIIVENEVLFDRKRIFGDARYIIVITEERANQASVTWEGRLQALKKCMDESVDKQNKLLKDVQSNITQKLNDKTTKLVKDMEIDINRVYGTILQRKENINQNIKEILDLIK